MRILITGGFGFVGGRLGQYLQQVGHQVVLGSREVSEPPDWLSEAEVVRTEWNNHIALEKVCADVDIVIHAAGVNAQDCVGDPVAALEFNGVATARLVKAASNRGVKRFIYISTAHVYANPLVGTVTEDTCPLNLHPYATTHRAGEDSLLGANQRGEMEGAVLRLSNAFGAPAHKNVNCWMLLVNDLCRQAVQIRKMVLHSNGLQQRNFIPLMDVGRAVRHLLALPRGDCADGLFNLGGETSLSVWDMAKRIARRCQIKLGFWPDIARPEPRVNEKTESLRYNCEKLLETGYTLKGVIEEAIDETLLFCAKERDRIV